MVFSAPLTTASPSSTTTFPYVSQIVACVLFLVFGVYFVMIRHHIWVGLICFIAFANYAAMCCQVGQFTYTTHDQTIRSDYLPRYLDWLVTTPLLLVTLVSATSCSSTQLSMSLYGFLIIVDVMMIYVGCLATIATSNALDQWILFGISMFFFIIVICILYRIRAPRLATSYLLTLWLLYPVLWILYTLSTIDEKGWNDGISVLDLFAKIGFGFVVLSCARK